MGENVSDESSNNLKVNDLILDFETADTNMDKLIFFKNYEENYKFYVIDKFSESLISQSKLISFLTNTSFFLTILYALY